MSEKTRWQRALGKLRTSLGISATATTLDNDALDALEAGLINIDVGVKLAEKWTRAAKTEGSLAGLRATVFSMLEKTAAPLDSILIPTPPIESATPYVVLLVGVNGAGKTTTIAKLAARYKAQGKSVLIAAGDTFRSAASAQLESLAARVGVDCIASAHGEDPAALCYRACAEAKQGKHDLLLIDTAGRLQARDDLMAQLAKMLRIIKKQCGDTAPHCRVLVLEASTGQNALSQYEAFHRCVDLSGLIVTKLDGTAKGGIILRLADAFPIRIFGVGLGEGMEDLVDLDPAAMTEAMLPDSPIVDGAG